MSTVQRRAYFTLPRVKEISASFIGCCNRLENALLYENRDDNGTRLPPIEQKHDDDGQHETNENSTKDNEVQHLFYFPKADMVRGCNAAGELEPSAGVWQHVAPYWDLVQIRCNQFRQYEVERRGAQPLDYMSLEKTKINKPVQINCFIDTLTRKEVRFSRPIPGFGGYVPRFPVLPRPPELCSNPALTSISRATYRLFPSYEYSKKKFAHKGPLSSTTTTTPPCNPFNKLDLINVSNQILLKRSNQVRLRKIRK